MKTSLSKKVIGLCSLCIASMVSFSQEYEANYSFEHAELQANVASPHTFILGSLSAKWESGNKGPATISTSIHDPGGASYGTYQISTKHGYISDYLKHEGAQFCEYFEDHEPGTSEFNKRWKRIALEKREDFHLAEHKFIKRTHYIPFVQRLKKHLQFNVSEYSPVMQDVIWSTAVQHGPNSQIIINALKYEAIHQLSEYEIIKKIYAERSKRRGNKLIYFPRVKDHWQSHLINRFDAEKNEALAQLRKFKLSELVSSDALKDRKIVTINKPIFTKEQRYRILLLTLDTPDYSFDDLTKNTVYTEWDEAIGFYNYYVGRYLNKTVAEQLLKMLKSKGYSVGKIIKHQ